LSLHSLLGCASGLHSFHAGTIAKDYRNIDLAVRGVFPGQSGCSRRGGPDFRFRVVLPNGRLPALWPMARTAIMDRKADWSGTSLAAQKITRTGFDERRVWPKLCRQSGGAASSSPFRDCRARERASQTAIGRLVGRSGFLVSAASAFSNNAG